MQLATTEANKHNRVRINILEIEGDNLHIEGLYYLPVGDDEYRLQVEYDDVVVPAKIHNIYGKKDVTDEETGELLYYSRVFGFDLPLEVGRKFKFRLLDAKGETLEDKALGFGAQAKITQLAPDGYYDSGKYILKPFTGGLSVLKNTFLTRLKCEYRFLRGLRKKVRRKAIRFRIPAKIWRRFKRKPVWIISDRTTVAGDNGEALFRYICSLPEAKKMRVYFLLNEDSRDFERMKKIGKVVSPDSYKYKLAFLVADWVISSQADRWTTDAFSRNLFFVKDQYRFRFAFLQHGITKDDVSSWLWKQNRFIDMFVTAGKREYESILTGDYDYDESVVKLTGFPRFDRLENEPTGKVFFLPTWRRNLATDRIKGTSERPYSELFKESEYCKFYNKLINDERIIEAMKAHGMTGEFYVHPSAANQAEDFVGNETIVAKNEPADYRRLFREGNLLVTDFSSVAFDFAYLKKPVIYSQFDKDTFFEGHLYTQGYFSYDDDGFGPVIVDYDEVVDAIVETINNGCVMEEKYIKRVEDFFEFTDRNNCKRVYETIRDM